MIVQHSHLNAACRVRGCPLVLPEISFSEWGTDGFLIAAHEAPANIPQHEHFPLQISFPARGSWVHSFGLEGSRILSPGEVAFIPSGSTHSTRGLDSGELITINAELEWCEENCDLTARTLRDANVRITNMPHLRGMLGEVSTLLQEPEPDQLYISSIGLTVTLGVFHRLDLRLQSQTPIGLFGPLRRVSRWVDENLSEKITLKALAFQGGYSQWHLIRLFRTFLGTTPARYVAGRRLERSRELLSIPGADICEIALRCGFSSQSHFTRAFAREYGLTPGAYRSKRRTAGIPS